MELIIGRDGATSRLKVSMGTQYKLYGNDGSVPRSVSHQHCKIVESPDSGYEISNLKAENVTYVNGVSIEQRHVTKNDIIELGPNRYRFSWDIVTSLKPTEKDIRPLERVWDDYHDTKLQLQIKQGKFNTIRSVTSVITMLAILCSFVLGHSFLYMLLYILAIGISVVFFVIAYINCSKMPKMFDELDKKFKSDYVCPECKRFLGYQSYDIMSQNKSCPYCKTTYIK